MSIQEVFYRIHEFFDQKIFYIFFLFKIGICSKKTFNYIDFKFTNSDEKCLPLLRWHDISQQEQNNILHGVHLCFGKEWIWKSSRDIWNISLENGNTWSRSHYAAIDYRLGNSVGDVRLVWEPSRLQQLVDLSLLIDSVGERQAKDLSEIMVSQFDHWVKENPFLSGVHYISSMECALRILSVCVAFDNIRRFAEFSIDAREMLLKFVWSNASYISNRISLYSSAGNHTIAECSGLLFAAVLFPEFPESSQWKAKGEKILFSEFDRQISSDGGGIEQAPWYQAFVLDLFGLVTRLYDKYDLPIPQHLVVKYQSSLNFLNTLASSYNDIPSIGDADSGYALSRFLKISWLDDFDRYGLTTFDDSGYTVYRNSDTCSKLIFDHGNLGMLPSCGHGHSDALSIILNIEDSEILIDPGTYTYTGDSNFRRYFRSSSAHNTVTIDGLDQARQVGPFLWTNSYDAELLHREILDNGDILLLASHTGYVEISLSHKRGMLIQKNGNILVLDSIDGSGIHRLDLNWNLGLEVSKQNNNEFYLCSDVFLRVKGGDVTLHCGDISPIFGWQSDVYGVKKKSETINVTYDGKLPHEFVTEVHVNCTSSSPEVMTKQIERIRRLIYDTRKN